ncbi:MAG: endonuclease/exonuclease/phosphatase family protein [Ruminococcus sp.]
MKIATWNVERLKHKKALDRIIQMCENVQADILVLTETDEQISLNYKYCIQTPLPLDITSPKFTQPLSYKSTEHRISIFTNYKIVQQHETFDKYSALCVELETNKGKLFVYGTIIGILGNRHVSFECDLRKQIEDYNNFSSGENNVCICGDFNCSFADNYYYTKSGRDLLLQTFAANNIKLLTSDVPSCIDHIAISKKFIDEDKIHIEEWNLDKALSDHKGIAAILQ